MIVNKVLDELFSTWSNIAVLRALENYAIGISGSEVARLAGLTTKNCLITLTGLEALGVVSRVRGGREHLFSLNRGHYLVNEVILPALVSEKRFVKLISQDIHRALKKISLSVFLFGSVARKEERIESDLDICIVFNNVFVKKQIEVTISELSLRLKKKYGVSLAPYYISKVDFLKRARSNKPPIAEIVREGIHISGKKISELLNG